MKIQTLLSSCRVCCGLWAGQRRPGTLTSGVTSVVGRQPWPRVPREHRPPPPALLLLSVEWGQNPGPCQGAGHPPRHAACVVHCGFGSSRTAQAPTLDPGRGSSIWSPRATQRGHTAHAGSPAHTSCKPAQAPQGVGVCVGPCRNQAERPALGPGPLGACWCRGVATFLR